MKPKIPAPDLNRQILDEASEWFVDFRVGDVDNAARERFDEWLRRSPEHIRAYWEIAKTYVYLPPASAFGKLNTDELIAYARSDANVVSLHERPGDAHTLREENARELLNEGRAERPPRRVRRPFFAAASVALAFVIGAAVWWQAHRYPLFTTDIGERRSITLSDGSTVDLNARSRLRVEYTGRERRVELLSGQALFQVAKDKLRPFIVHSGEATVRAVGTQFDVYRKDSGTTITVLEGRVAVYSTARNKPPAAQSHTTSGQTNTGINAAAQHPRTRDSTRDFSSTPPNARSSLDSSGGAAEVPDSALTGASGAGAIFLSAGEQVTVMPDEMGTPVPQHADLNAATAWMQRKLVFEGSKLADVVDEFNRYNRQQLVIEDSKLRDFQISGVYSSTDPASLVLFLKDQGLRVTTAGNDVRISAQ